MANDQPKFALMVSGQVFAKSEFPPVGDRPARYSIDLAVSGLKQMLTLNLPFAEWSKIELMSVYRSQVSYNLWKGNVYWQVAE